MLDGQQVVEINSGVLLFGLGDCMGEISYIEMGKEGGKVDLEILVVSD